MLAVDWRKRCSQGVEMWGLHCHVFRHGHQPACKIQTSEDWMKLARILFEFQNNVGLECSHYTLSYFLLWKCMFNFFSYKSFLEVIICFLTELGIEIWASSLWDADEHTADVLTLPLFRISSWWREGNDQVRARIGTSHLKNQGCNQPQIANV